MGLLTETNLQLNYFVLGCLEFVGTLHTNDVCFILTFFGGGVCVVRQMCQVSFGSKKTHRMGESRVF